MKRMLIGGAAAAAIMAASPVLAADLPVYEPVAPAPAPVASVAVPTWTGFYLGAGAGYSWYEPELDVDFDDDDLDLDGFSSDGGDFDLSGFVVQGTLGADVQFGRFVVGALADVRWYSGDDEVDVAFFDEDDLVGSYSAEVESQWGWDVGARAGFLVTDRVLAYGLAGWSWRYGDLEYADGDDSYEYDIDVDGWMVGAGVEAMVTDMVSVKGEYRYTDFDDIEEDLGGTFEDSDSSVNFGGEQHEFLVGVNVRFNGLFN